MDKMLFYDTNALLNLQDKAFKEPFFIAQKTLEEIEGIKTSGTKDGEVKYKARKIAHLLDDFYETYHVVPYNDDVKTILADFSLESTPDNIILASAYYVNETDTQILVCTDDLNCKFISRNIFQLPTKGINEINLVTNAEEYTGYRDVTLSDEEMSDFYTNMSRNTFNLIMNQYLIIRKSDGEVVDLLIWKGNEYQVVKFPTVKSNFFGSVKPLNGDVYQRMVLNSLAYNQITMIKGPAGTGKSYLAIGYLMWLLEKRKIDKIIIFCNTVATANSAKLGYYPGTKDEKLLDSSIGNMLSSKLGDAFGLEEMMAKGRIQLLPMSDVRGFDTSGMNAGVYITEAQNMDIQLMKLALQRIGEDSICIIDGDYNAQVDLSQYAGFNNGMRRMSEIFRGENIYGEVELKNIYRSKIAMIAERM